METRGKDEEAALVNVQAVMSSYAVEIAMKSLWALDNPAESVPHEHNLATIFDGLKEETVSSLKLLQLTREVLETRPSPFVSNRYSMESSSRDITVYQTWFLRSIIQLLRDKVAETREALLKPPQASTALRSRSMCRAIRSSMGSGSGVRTIQGLGTEFQQTAPGVSTFQTGPCGRRPNGHLVRGCQDMRTHLGDAPGKTPAIEKGREPSVC